jgi:hypothetical protein
MTAPGEPLICPFTFVSTLPLSSAPDELFRFPLKSLSAPALTWTPPATTSWNNVAYPIVIPVSGTWSDPSNALTHIEVLLQASKETTPRTLLNMTFAACASKAFSVKATLEGSDNYTLILTGTDSLGLSTTHTVDLSATSTVTTPTVAAPILTLADGTPVPIFDTGQTAWSGTEFSWDTSPVQENYNPYFDFKLSPMAGGPAIPFGPLLINCPTPGTEIFFYSDVYVGLSGQTFTPHARNGNNHVNYASYQPLVMPGTGDGLFYIFMQASLVVGSHTYVSTIQGAIIQVGPPAGEYVI